MTPHEKEIAAKLLYIRTLAVDYCANGIACNVDWEELANNMLNSRPYSLLFPDGATDEARDEAMSIIHEAEDREQDKEDKRLREAPDDTPCLDDSFHRHEMDIG